MDKQSVLDFVLHNNILKSIYYWKNRNKIQITNIISYARLQKCVIVSNSQEDCLFLGIGTSMINCAINFSGGVTP